ncbi:MAG TPA: class I SAM-dependent methyltransferase [Gemmatimonadaceae bacterium]|nr:class I SAM-dependent methyltransferase [Gemmatimonadaceae bacterium]
MSVQSQRPNEEVLDAWESAYLRFETPQQEEHKFVRRLVAAGAATWDKHALILDLFCGRGGGARALHHLGFRRVVGLDLSPRLLRARVDSSHCMVADCRLLPVATGSADIAIVQGGLHHLPTIPEDLRAVLREVGRVLRRGGLFVAVEPWDTPFLRLVHRVCELSLARRALAKIDALATMIDHERTTYEAWLRNGTVILSEFDKHFERRQARIGFGKIHYVGTPRLA